MPKRTSDVARSVFDRYNDDVANDQAWWLTSAWPNRDYCCSPAPNSCALNCRAVGERFYATLEPAVIDGTPCDAPNLRGRGGAGGISTERSGERWLCVAGQCKVWIAWALGERTMPEINDRHQADAIRYDRSIRSLLIRALGSLPRATILSHSFLMSLRFIECPMQFSQIYLSINNVWNYSTPSRFQ